MLVSPSQSNAGDLITAAAINGPVNQLAAVLNGNVDATNIAAGSVGLTQLSSSIGTALAGGYSALAATPNTITYNGNRSYTLVWNGTDYSGVLSPGMRVRTTRTAVAPTQCSSLNGTTQYWTKAAPASMAQTDTITVMGWIKPTAYQQGVLISRANGTTDGWQCYIGADGRINFGGVRAADDVVTSYQSITLNKWQHFAATINSAGAVGTMYLDGASIPVSYANNANTGFLLPTGTLAIGASSAGASPFAGKVAQMAVFSAVLTQSTIQSYYSQGLAGTETNLISAYSFSASSNDLNTTNANNLTANGSVTATTADSPFGGQANGTISSTLDYGVVRDVSFSTNTTVTVQAVSGCTIPTTGGVSAVVYSGSDTPFGFPGGVNDLGYAQLCTTFSTTSTTAVQVLGLTITTYVPPNRDVEFVFQARDIFGVTVHDVTVWEGAVGVGIQVGGTEPNVTGGASVPTINGVYRPSSSGIKTYNIGYRVNTSTGTLEGTTVAPVLMRIKLAS